ncbi:MAG: hypothetical protein O3A84_09770 [Proteobacteria bacterium]|nr:hypothetical protein [Pseudomonadota bacterium]
MLQNIASFGIRRFAFPENLDVALKSLYLADNREADAVTLVYTDRGIAFNPLTDLDLSDPVDGVEGSIGGWGWPLIKRYCETITYDRDDETNRLRLVLSLAD